MIAAGLVFTGCGTDEPSKNAATTSSSPSSQRDPQQRYTAGTTVLESERHGPQLCLGAVNQSYPPQCGGPDIEGWDWDAVADKESALGTTWAEVTVVGTFDGATFTLTEPPKPASKRQPGERSDFSPVCSDPEGDRTADRSEFREPEHPDLIAVWVSADQETINVLVRPGAVDAIRKEVRTRFSGLLCIEERDLPTQASLRALQDRIFDESKESPLGGVLAAYSDGRRGVVVVECALADDVSKAWAREQWGETVELRGALTPIE
jgi:hypothetical protein